MEGLSGFLWIYLFSGVGDPFLYKGWSSGRYGRLFRRPVDSYPSRVNGPNFTNDSGVLEVSDEQTVSTINLVANISGRGSAGTDEQEADGSGLGDEQSGTPQGSDPLSRTLRWRDQLDLTPQDLDALRFLAERAD